MTDGLSSALFPGVSLVGVDRSLAAAAARRHSKHVRLMKRGIILGAASGTVFLIGNAVVDPFSNVPANISIASASLSGTKITMELPKLNGFRRDGKPYQVRARAGIQDIRNPKLIELSEIEARIQVEENNVVNVIAPAGVFDSGADSMKLYTKEAGETITLKSTSGYAVILKTADVNLKAGSLVSSEPVSVRLPNGTITANTVAVGDSGRNVTFEGNVRSEFKSKTDDASPGAEQNE